MSKRASLSLPLAFHRCRGFSASGLIVCFIAGLFAEVADAQFGGGGLPLLVPIEVESFELDGDFLRNGMPFSSNVLDGGQVWLRSETFDETILGQSWNGAYGPTRLMAGRYQPRFTSFFQPATAPRANAMPVSGDFELAADQTQDVDVAAVLVQTSFLLNGVSFPGGQTDLAEFYLRSVETGREVFIGTSHDGANSLYVVPGVYDVIYAYRSGGNIPRNTHARVVQEVLIDSDVVINVDVTSVGRVFSYSVNGAPFPASGLDYGRITLEIPETGDALEIGRTDSRDFVRLIPGTYQAVYCARQSRDFSPANPRAVVDEALTILPTGANGVEIGVVAHTVQPVFLMDGFGFPGNGLAYGRVLLDMGEGERLALGNTHQVADPVILIEGSYDAYYAVQQPDAAIPANTLTRFETGIMVDATEPLAFDVPTATLDLDVLLDGAPFPVSGLNNAEIVLHDPEMDSDTVLGVGYEAPFSTRVVRGDYDVVYNRLQAQGEVPVNPHHVVERGLAVAAPTTETINIQTRLIAPRFTLDGALFPADASNFGDFFLRDLDGDEISLGTSNLVAPDVKIIQGAYTAEYEWRAGNAVPVNHAEVVGIVSVPEPSFAAGLLLCASAGLLGCGSARRRSRCV
ncbi:MAG: hypothetical protein AB8G23_06030 [Myxococcota bacterium]